jgi:hypothetical protein
MYILFLGLFFDLEALAGRFINLQMTLLTCKKGDVDEKTKTENEKTKHRGETTERKECRLL